MAKKLGKINVQYIQNLKDRRILYCDNEIITYWYDGTITTSKDSKSETEKCSESIMKKPKMIFY